MHLQRGKGKGGTTCRSLVNIRRHLNIKLDSYIYIPMASLLIAARLTLEGQGGNDVGLVLNVDRLIDYEINGVH